MCIRVLARYRFQSQVAILGWGYTIGYRVLGGDNMFQSQVAILGWGYTRWKHFDLRLCKFQSQVAILGWGYEREGEWFGLLVAVSIAGGDSWVGIRQSAPGQLLGLPVSIAGGDSWVGIRGGNRYCVCF